MKRLLSIMFVAVIGAGSALAQQVPGGKHMMPVQTTAAGEKSGKGTGLIQQIDREKGTVIIKHGPLQGLDMPAMTMSFQVKDKAMLSNLQPLQKVEFDLTYDGKDYTITRIK